MLNRSYARTSAGSVGQRPLRQELDRIAIGNDLVALVENEAFPFTHRALEPHDEIVQSQAGHASYQGRDGRARVPGNGHNEADNLLTPAE